MVYRGKPSLGCYSCRTRRIKCDQIRPGCTQCANIGSKCPGYRDPLDLMFRDESVAIRQKARAKAKRNKKDDPVLAKALGAKEGSETDSSSSSSGSDSRSSPECRPIVPIVTGSVRDQPMPMATQVYFHVEEFALTFFLGTYISGSRWEYVPLLYNTTTRPDASFILSVTASALASLSQELESPEIASIGRKYYAKALKSTNEALASKQLSVRDDTLASILVLSLFESINQVDEMSRSSWEAHINGAAALLKLRGSKQFETNVGRLLFMHASDSIRISCIQHCIFVPEYLLSYHREAVSKMDGLVIDISNLTTRMANLRAKMVNTAADDPYVMIEEICQLQEELLSVKDRLPEQVNYKVCHTSTPSPNVWGQKYHIYKTHRNMRLWNTLRMIQVWITVALWRLTSYVVVSCLPEPPGVDVDTDLIQQTTAERLKTAAEEICASVPFVMGDIQAPDGVQPSRFASSLNLIWPLSLLGESTLVSVGMRNYAIEQLRRIGQRNKIPQAVATADSISKRVKNKIWVHMCHTS